MVSFKENTQQMIFKATDTEHVTCQDFARPAERLGNREAPFIQKICTVRKESTKISLSIRNQPTYL